MKQVQVQGTAPVSGESDVEAVAIRNFEARHFRGDRAWSKDRINPRRPALVLSERERAEFIEQARHQLARGERKTAMGRSFS